MDKLMDARQLASRMGVSVETVRWWRKQGTGPAAVKVGRRVFYAEVDVLRWMHEHREPAGVK